MMQKSISELVHLTNTHPNPVTRSVFREILFNRLIQEEKPNQQQKEKSHANT